MFKSIKGCDEYNTIFFYYILNGDTNDILNAVNTVKDLSLNNEIYAFLLSFCNESQVQNGILKFGTFKNSISVNYDINFNNIASTLAKDFENLELSGKAISQKNNITTWYYSEENNSKVFIDEENQTNQNINKLLKEFKYKFYMQELNSAADNFTTKVVVISSKKKNDRIKALNNNERIIIERDIDNAYDDEAIIIKDSNNQTLGHLENNVSKYLSALIDKNIIKLNNCVVLNTQIIDNSEIGIKRPILEINFNIDFAKQDFKRLIIHKDCIELKEAELCDDIEIIQTSYFNNDNSRVNTIPIENILNYDFDKNGRIYNHINTTFQKYITQNNNKFTINNAIEDILSIIDFKGYTKNIIELSNSSIIEVKSILAFIVEELINNISLNENEEFETIMKKERINSNLYSLLNTMRFLFSPKVDFYEQELISGFEIFNKISPEVVSLSIANYNIDYTQDVLIQKLNFYHSIIDNILKSNIDGFIIKNGKLNAIIALSAINKGIIKFQKKDIVFDNYCHYIKDFDYSNDIICYPYISIGIYKLKQLIINFVDYIENNKDLIINLNYISPNITELFNNELVTAFSFLKLFSSNYAYFSFKDDFVTNEQYYNVELSKDIETGIPNYKFFFAELLKEVIAYNENRINFNNISFNTLGQNNTIVEIYDNTTENFSNDEIKEDKAPENTLSDIIKNVDIYRVDKKEFENQINDFVSFFSQLIDNYKIELNYTINKEIDLYKTAIEFLTNLIKDIKSEYNMKISGITENFNASSVSDYQEVKVVMERIGTILNTYTEKLLKMIKAFINIQKTMPLNELTETLIIYITNTCHTIVNDINQELYVDFGEYGKKTFISKDISTAKNIIHSLDIEFEKLPSVVKQREQELIEQEALREKKEAEEKEKRKKELEKQIVETSQDYEQLKNSLFKSKQKEELRKKIFELKQMLNLLK